MTKINKTIVEVVRVGVDDAGRVVGRSLKALREVAGLTQIQMAHRLNVGQAAISKIEHRGDVQISSVQNYVEALGARLHIYAAFPADADLAAQLKEAFDLDAPDKNQLILPIFSEDLFRPQRDVVLSVRPQYSDKIIEGKKTVELRRRFPTSAPRGMIAYIYSTSPVRAMVGQAEIANVIKLPVSEIWQKYAGRALINKDDFDSYFDGVNEGFALKFKNARPLPRRIDLSELRERFGFEPPQSFVYAKAVLRRALQNEYSNVSH